MTILGRIADLFQAKTHKLLTMMEDPAESLDLSYEKMVTGLQQTRRHLADVTTERTALERQISAGEGEVAQAESDAKTALQAAREDLARAALRHKQSALEKIEGLRQAHAAMVPQIDRLIGYQRTLQDRIEKFRTEKEVMKAKYAAAQAQVKVTESLTGIGTNLGGVGDTLRRATERVEHTQDRADTMATLLEQGVLSDPLDGRSQDDKELHQLRAGSAIDADMARLKAELGVADPRPTLRIEGRPEAEQPR
jgi:phage shock protein A